MCRAVARAGLRRWSRGGAGGLFGVQYRAGPGPGCPAGRAECAGYGDGEPGQGEHQQVGAAQDVQEAAGQRGAVQRGAGCDLAHEVILDGQAGGEGDGRGDDGGGDDPADPIVMVCRGVIPTALNTPRSCTRSRVAISAALSTPSPASTPTSRVSHANKDVSRNRPSDDAPSVPTTMSGPSARRIAPTSALV